MAHHSPVRRNAALKSRLDDLVLTFDVSTISPDPLEIPRRYSSPADQEITGIIAAAFAYGRADIVVRNTTSIVERMGTSPHAYLQDEFDRRDAARRFAGFSHRFHKTPDLVALLGCLAGAVRRYGTLGSFFQSVDDPTEDDIGPALARFVAGLLSFSSPRDARGPLRYLLTSPDDGSACKRMNLYLRWMVRRTEPDLGLWTFVDPSRLVMPLDTHIHRISTFLGLNRRKSADWKAARLLTDRLMAFDPSDPVRYDFALCRLGILDLCSRKQSRELCDVCLLRDVCRFPVV